MSLTSNINLLTERIAQEFNSVQTQIAGLGGGGGSGGIVAPTASGFFALSADHNLSNNQTAIITGASKPAGTYIDVHTMNTWDAAKFTLNYGDGGITVTDAGKYIVRFKFVCRSNTAPTNASQGIKHALLVNGVEKLSAKGFQSFQPTNNSGSLGNYHVFWELDAEGIVDIPANGVVTLTINPQAYGSNLSTSSHIQINLTSLF